MPELQRVTHPRPHLAGWTCSECGADHLASGHACPSCHALLCEDCAARSTEHDIPAGHAAGRPCTARPASDETDADDADAEPLAAE